MLADQLIECVPNFSEGRDPSKIASIAKAIRGIEDVELLHIDTGYDANRTVFTLVGQPNAVVEAMIDAFRTSKQLCSMANHLGTHPRLGLLDVCPFIPLRNISLAETNKHALSFARRIGAEFDQTVFLYESSASMPSRRNLADIRRGEYEGLERKLKKEDWQPDFGSKTFLPETGATVVGARPFLIAFNVNLDSKSVPIAQSIAKKIRTSGYQKELTPGGLKQRIPGLFPKLKAIGWYVKEYELAQVSMNLTDYTETGMHEAYEACKRMAKELGTDVVGSELIGLVPLEAILQAGRYYATRDHTSDRSESSLVKLADKHLGLSALQPFVPEDRIIDYQIRRNI